MNQHKTLKGELIPLDELDAAEKAILEELHLFLGTNKDWGTFTGFWMTKIGEYYDRRGLTRKEAIQTPLFRIAQDLDGRLAVELGLARAPSPNPSYRDQLIRLILQRYRTRRDFCQKAGISEDLLSHVLAGRKDFAIETLAKALERIGYRLQIVPIANGEK